MGGAQPANRPHRLRNLSLVLKPVLQRDTRLNKYIQDMTRRHFQQVFNTSVWWSTTVCVRNLSTTRYHELCLDDTPLLISMLSVPISFVHVCSHCVKFHVISV